MREIPREVCWCDACTYTLLQQITLLERSVKNKGSLLIDIWCRELLDDSNLSHEHSFFHNAAWRSCFQPCKKHVKAMPKPGKVRFFMSKPGKGSFLLLHHSSVQVGAWKEEAQILSCLPDKANVLSITPCYVPLVSLKHAAVMAIWGPFVEKQP